MNGRIKELLGQAYDEAVPETWTTLSSEQLERIYDKFAELIVQECANWINENVGMINEDARADLHKHFGVEKCHFTLTQTNVGIAEFKNERTNSRTS